MQPLRIAVLGMVDGNGHPYSWSAMFNNYDKEIMAECPYPAIPGYLAKEPEDKLRIPGANVTHIWTDDPADAIHVAKAARIPNVVSRPEDVIGHVDAVLITTDKGYEHVERCRPFVEAGLPIFVDKPLVDNETDLKQFQRWVRDGARIMSSSCMRYCKEFMPYRTSIYSLGQLRFSSITTCKSWERYGIHALESIYPILGPGFISAQNTGTKERNIVLFKHGIHGDVAVIAIEDMYGSHGMLQLCGTSASAAVSFQDTFYSFKSQLEAFISYLRTGERPFPFSETEELMRMVIAGIRSREENGRVVLLEEIAAD
ncbi:Gfo/Idh/MocA family oxidoreductase [Paenibacillus sp. Soil750]|uniref:Gfo/Idh/MocA family oxidoreductase n=1 Tax=Paenibacillus sp. Soil750 TaxID=1736398 RepID=UPI0006FB1A8D|nr:Gfo/Idh/MocA family oxidoreductase [Paenibacillus sp. Soil750]KRE64830.1 oxidoreductase [Paenibacillus sp. Soil750]